mmetsp:Transcript_17039/g.41882  ORF Transcript_17039/g.41882 Transcript_17039/m.41882 type:complete len:223 (-) Transcript_17039:287-955(-)
MAATALELPRSFHQQAQEQEMLQVLEAFEEAPDDVRVVGYAAGGGDKGNKRTKSRRTDGERSGDSRSEDSDTVQHDSEATDDRTATAAAAADAAAPAGAAAAAVAVAAKTSSYTDGVHWVLSDLGKFESCREKCVRLGKQCSERHWPDNFREFISVVGRTAPDEGRSGICGQVLEQDASKHCSHSVVALSGRCFYHSSQPAPPSCDVVEKEHSDCQQFCPCI